MAELPIIAFADAKYQNCMHSSIMILAQRLLQLIANDLIQFTDAPVSKRKEENLFFAMNSSKSQNFLLTMFSYFFLVRRFTWVSQNSIKLFPLCRCKHYRITKGRLTFRTTQFIFIEKVTAAINTYLMILEVSWIKPRQHNKVNTTVEWTSKPREGLAGCLFLLSTRNLVNHQISVPLDNKGRTATMPLMWLIVENLIFQMLQSLFIG